MVVYNTRYKGWSCQTPHNTAGRKGIALFLVCCVLYSCLSLLILFYSLLLNTYYTLNPVFVRLKHSAAAAVTALTVMQSPFSPRFRTTSISGGPTKTCWWGSHVFTEASLSECVVWGGYLGRAVVGTRPPVQGRPPTRHVGLDTCPSLGEWRWICSPLTTMPTVQFGSL